METGFVKWFNEAQGFGYIVPHSGEGEVYVSIATLKKCGLSNLTIGQKVEYEATQGYSKKQVYLIRLERT